MNTWKSFLALTVAGMVVAGPVWAQSQKQEDKSLQAPANPATKSGDTSKSKSPDMSAPSGSSSAPSASPSTDTKRGGDTTKSDTMKSDTTRSDTMKSDSMKSDTMKSDTMKSDRGGRMARGGHRDQVRAVQQALKDKGHDPGDIDGVIGAKTKAALKDFQKAEGLKETGMLDNDTKAKLGIEGGMKSSSTGSSASPSASPATAPATGGSTGTGGASGGSTDHDKTPKTK